MKRLRISEWIGRNWARLSYSHFVEPVWLEHNHIDLPIPNLPQELDGLRILHLTDFHLCDRVPAVHLRQAVEAGRRLECPIIALTGDFIHAGHRHVKAMAAILTRLAAPLGVYAVLGNHDYSVRNISGVRRYPHLADDVTKALTDVGITVLHNEHRLLEYHGAQVAVAGVADLWCRESDVPRALKGIDPQVPRILLAHNPRSLDQLEGNRCDVMLSGHTHGGQILFEKIGRPMLSRKMKGYAAGLYYHDSGYLYVNKGVGFTVRFRFNVRPELAVLTFRRANLGAL